MFTKDIENIIDALPAFLKLALNASNPLTDAGPETSPMDLVVKAIWFVVPFHVLAFLGLVPLEEGDSLFILVLAFGTILLLSWVGVAIGLALSFLYALKSDQQQRLIGGWVATLLLSWFICVLVLSLLGFFLWMMREESSWPNLVSVINAWTLVTFRETLGSLFVTVLPALVGSVCLLLLYGREGRGSARQQAFVFLMCWFANALMLLFSIKFLEPVTRTVTG